jgi:hypothetical protein
MFMQSNANISVCNVIQLAVRMMNRHRLLIIIIIIIIIIVNHIATNRYLDYSLEG